jgi:hypothetical protein
MYITVDPSRLIQLIPIILPGDRVEAKIPEYPFNVSLNVCEATADGVHGTLDLKRVTPMLRCFDYELSEIKDVVYFAPWVKVDRLYMRE